MHDDEHIRRPRTTADAPKAEPEPLGERPRRKRRFRDLRLPSHGSSAWLVASFVLFVVSLFAPASIPDDLTQIRPGGWGYFLWGAVFALYVPFMFFHAMMAAPGQPPMLQAALFYATWYANVFLMFGWAAVLGLSPRTGAFGRCMAWLMPAVAVVVAASAMLVDEPSAKQITTPSPAYWLWLSSMAACAVAGGVALRRVRPEERVYVFSEEDDR